MRIHVSSIGSQGTSASAQDMLRYAVYISNLFFLTSDAIATIVIDTDVTKEQLGACTIYL